MNNIKKYKKESTDKYALKLSPMRELEFIDPITGMLPKNVHELVKAKIESRSATKESVSKTTRRQNDKFDLKLQRMPELALIDPITGALPKNYKKLLTENKGNLSNCHNSKSKELKFDISKVQASKPRLSTSGCTSYENKGVRKVLFKDISQSSKNVKSNAPQILITERTETDESVLLNMEETEEKMLVLKKKPKSAVNSRLTPVQRKSNLKKNNSGSNSSLEEFLKLEKQLKTPKSITKQKIKKQEFKLPNHINDIMQKLAENQKLFEEFKNGIEKNNKEINDNLQKILDFINKNENCDASNVQKSTDENTSPNVMPNNCALTKNLRVATLQKNLEKKVIFDLNKNGDDGNRSENQPITLKTIIAQTPKTMFRNVSQKANEQLSKLEDTPKSTFNRFA